MRFRAANFAATISIAVSLQAAQPIYPPSGFDLTAIDPAVKPGDDFFLHANGAYLARTKIPADQTLATRRYEMSVRTEAHLHEALEDAAKDAPAEPTDTKGKVGAFYAAFMDEAAIEAAGAKPIAPEIDAIRAAPDRAVLAGLMGQYGLYPSPFAYYIDSDQKKPGAYAAYLGQKDLGLPDRDYYLTPDFEAQRTAYRNYAARLLDLIGWRDADRAADDILAFETKLAEASWSKTQQRDPTTQYNPMSPDELAAYAPGFDWAPFLAGAGLDKKPTLIVTTNTALPKLAAIVASAPIETLKAWMAFRTADLAAPYMAKAFADAHFDLHGHTLQGQAEQQARWKRAILATGGGDCGADPASCFGTLDWATGELYTARYFPPETKTTIEALIPNIKSAFRHRIQTLAWMSPKTKAEALKKLDTYVVKVGYPDRPRDYSGVVVKRDDPVGNMRRAAAYEWAFQLGRSDGPVDQSDWLMTPQTNDAYNGSLRDIVFPAAFLQAPIFDAAADPAYNYGAIGGVIGHEMTHGFDDQGRHIDATGALRDWWTPADDAAFRARAKTLGDQFATYEPVPGMHINPELTMGENLADLGGLSIALDAYHASLKGKKAPVVDGLTSDQRVFLGWAQAWAGKMRPEAIAKQTASDPHSYRKFRVNGIVRNIDGWYAAFGIKPGDALYIAPEQRARVW
ncbi:M13 family metallopeptidase [Sphingomonas sp. MMS24-J13]|uniref:M13 family metallopeptidase n=1 Tax=Sphingomonas sp. MMS24-J13 TaxID=3238686 RepID=UPI00385042AD